MFINQVVEDRSGNVWIMLYNNGIQKLNPKSGKFTAFRLPRTNEENQLELAKLTNILAVNKYALQDDFYTKTNNGDLMSKARVISAKQLNKIQPVYKTQKGQKDINNIINAAVQEILLDKGSTKDVLDKAAKDWKSIEE